MALADFSFLARGIKPATPEDLSRGLLRGISTGLAIQQQRNQNKQLQMEEAEVQRRMQQWDKVNEIRTKDPDNAVNRLQRGEAGKVGMEVAGNIISQKAQQVQIQKDIQEFTINASEEQRTNRIHNTQQVGKAANAAMLGATRQEKIQTFIEGISGFVPPQAIGTIQQSLAQSPDIDLALKQQSIMALSNEKGLQIAQAGVTGDLSPEQSKFSKDQFNKFITLPSTQRFINSQIATQKLLNLEGGATDDVAMVFNFMKVLDPTSTVREGEFATAEQAKGVPSRIRNVYNKVLEGERLTDEQREEFKKTASRQFKAELQSHNTIAEQFKEQARKRDVPEDMVVPNLVTIDLDATEVKSDVKVITQQEIANTAKSRGISEQQVKEMLSNHLRRQNVQFRFE